MGNYPPTAYKASRKIGFNGQQRERSRRNTSKKHSLSNSVTSTSTDTHLTDDDSLREQQDQQRRSSPQQQVYRQHKPLPDNAPSEIKLIRQYLYHKDAHNLEGMKSLTHEDCYFYFVDAEAEMPQHEFYGALTDTFASFPDLHFFWKSMKVSGRDPATGGTVIKVRDYYGIGKHDGKPYAFGPYEEIPPTGITVRDEDIQFTFIVKDGKLVNAKIDAFGGLVGPPGFYTKIGGIIPGL